MAIKYCSKCGSKMEPINLNKYDKKTGKQIIGYECPIKTNMMENYLKNRHRVFGFGSPNSDEWDNYNHDSDRDWWDFKYWQDFVPD